MVCPAGGTSFEDSYTITTVDVPPICQRKPAMHKLPLWRGESQQFSLWRFRSESPPNPISCSSTDQSKSGANPSSPTRILHERENKRQRA